VIPERIIFISRGINVLYGRTITHNWKACGRKVTASFQVTAQHVHGNSEEILNIHQDSGRLGKVVNQDSPQCETRVPTTKLFPLVNSQYFNEE